LSDDTKCAMLSMVLLGLIIRTRWRFESSHCHAAILLCFCKFVRITNLPHVKCMMKVGNKSSRYALYGLGYPYDTMVFTMSDLNLYFG
jgi:hypothetical protein